jgi:predicted dehydrogenase
MREYHKPLPEFVDRFGAAYKSELSAFIDCCRTNAPFPTTHRDGVSAQAAISAAMNVMFGTSKAADVS